MAAALAPTLFAACTGAGYVPPVEEGRGAIINGIACEASEEPTAVALLVEATLEVPILGELPIKSVACTGTLIAPDVVLAAAHCVDAEVLGQGFATATDIRFFVTPDADLTALSSMMMAEFPASAIEASSWVQHEGFDISELEQGVNGPGVYDDISLLFLSRPLTDVEPERVVTAEEAAALVTGAEVRIAGWGAQTEDTGSIIMPPPPGTVGRKVCGDSFIGVVGTHEFQVGGDQNSTRKCKGDSGGPTYLVVDPGSAFPRRVIGVTSHSFDESLCDEGGVDTRVDAYLDWLDAAMRERCAAGERAWCEIPGLIPPDAPPVMVEGGGELPDAGMPDSGSSAPDGGAVADAGPDAGGLDDGGVDAGGLDDAGTKGDAGSDGRGELRPSDGCRCGGRTGAPSWAWLGLGLVLVGFRRRR